MNIINIDEVYDAVIEVLYADIIKIILTKTGLTNDSSLVQSVNIVRDVNGLLVQMNDYAFYLDRGRKSKRQQPSIKAVPYNVILRWVIKNKIHLKFNKSARQVAFVIQKSILKKGIRPRNFLNDIVKQLENVTGFVSEKEIVKQLENSMDNLFDFV